jgi:hypothetical protein
MILRTITRPVTMPKQHLLSKSFPNALCTLVDKTKNIMCMINIGVRKHTNTDSIYDKTKKYTKLPHETKQQRHIVTSDNYTRSETSVVPNTLDKSYKILNPKQWISIIQRTAVLEHSTLCTNLSVTNNNFGEPVWIWWWWWWWWWYLHWRWMAS